MIILSEQQIQEIEDELSKSISTLDERICRAEQALKNGLSEIGVEASAERVSALQEELKNYGSGVRELRADCAELRKKLHFMIDPETQKNSEEHDLKEKLANEIQKETHNAPPSFSDFVKGLLMWKDSPEDRMSA